MQRALEDVDAPTLIYEYLPWTHEMSTSSTRGHAARRGHCNFNSVIMNFVIMHAACMFAFCTTNSNSTIDYRNIRRTTIRRILAIHQLHWDGADRRGLLVTLYTLAGTVLTTGSWTTWVSVRLPTSVGQCMGWPTILLRWILFYAQPDQRTLSLFRPAPRVHPGRWGLSPAIRKLHLAWSAPM